MKVRSGLALLAFGTASIALAPLVMRGKKLNGPLDTLSIVGDVVDFRVSPDGVWAVYLADPDTPGVDELYSTRRDGTGQIVRLSGLLVTGRAIRYWEITPDSARVVYLADQDTDGLDELYSAPIDGSSAAVKLNGTIVAGGGILDYHPFALTSDGQTLLYVAEQDVDGEQHLYRVPTDASAASVAIAVPSVPGGDVLGARVVSGDATALFAGTMLSAGMTELFKVPIDGSSAPVRMHPALLYGDVNGFDVSPDATWVVYSSDDNIHLQTDVFSVPLDLSSAPVMLNGPLASTLSDVREFSIDPTSTRVIYQADQDIYNVKELYSAPIDGSAAAVKLSQTLTSGSASLLYPRETSFTPDGSFVAYHTSPGGSFNQLYSAPPDGSAAATLLTLANGYVSQARITPDGARVVFTGAQPRSGTTNQLFSVPIDGSSAATRLSDPVPDQTRVAGFAVTADSATVVYFSGASSATQPNVHAVATDGSSAPVSLAMGAPWMDIDKIAVESSSATALYLGDTATPSTDELFATPLDGSQSPRRVNGPFPGVPSTGEIQSFTLAPGGSWAVYVDPQGFHSVNVRGDEPPALLSPVELVNAPSTGFRDEILFSHDLEYVFFTIGIGRIQLLYRAPIRGDEEPTLLHFVEGDAFNRFFGFRLTPDGRHLVYRYFIFDYFGPPNYGAVYSVAADGSAPPVLLESGISSSGLEITPDGTTAVFPVGGIGYLGYIDHELFSAPADGSAPTTEIFMNGPLQYDGELQLASGGTRVVYQTVDDTTFVRELWSSRIDGSVHTLLADGFNTSSSERKTHIRVSPVDTQVAYVREGPTAYEIYHGPVDGSVPATLLASVPLTRRVDDILFTPDGSRLVYLADAQTDDQYELFSVPTDGSQAAVKVNGPLVAGGDVTFFTPSQGGRRHFLVTPDGSTVVYRADARIDDRFELFAAPITGGPAIMLHNPLGPGLQIHPDFQLLSDSERVLYRGEPTSTLTPVWLARLDGTGEYKRLTDASQHPYSVESGFQVTSNERYVVYRADLDTEGTVELYAFPLQADVRLAPTPEKSLERSAD